jgi:hypothetical protein
VRGTGFEDSVGFSASPGECPGSILNEATNISFYILSNSLFNMIMSLPMPLFSRTMLGRRIEGLELNPHPCTKEFGNASDSYLGGAQFNSRPEKHNILRWVGCILLCYNYIGDWHKLITIDYII